jgi:hypothetical protein
MPLMLRASPSRGLGVTAVTRVPDRRTGRDRSVGGGQLRAYSHHIMRFFARNGIAMTIQETPTTMTLQLDGVIYSEGFNRETFLQTLDSLNACVEQIHTLTPEGDHDGHPVPGYSCRMLAPASRRTQ